MSSVSSQSCKPWRCKTIYKLTKKNPCRLQLQWLHPLQLCPLLPNSVKMRSCGLKIEDVVMKIGDFVTKYKMFRGTTCWWLWWCCSQGVHARRERNLINHFLVDENWQWDIPGFQSCVLKDSQSFNLGKVYVDEIGAGQEKRGKGWHIGESFMKRQKFRWREG
jgi:hypothetical protein